MLKIFGWYAEWSKSDLTRLKNWKALSRDFSITLQHLLHVKRNFTVKDFVGNPECNSLTSTLNTRNITFLKKLLVVNGHKNFPASIETKKFTALPTTSPKTCPHLESRNAFDKLPTFFLKNFKIIIIPSTSRSSSWSLSLHIFRFQACLNLILMLFRPCIIV
jgi:hypothetical protein